MKRRHVLAATTALGGLTTTAGCSAAVPFLAPRPHTTFDGSVWADEPLVTPDEPSPTAGPPHQYGQVVTAENQQQIRWEYIKQELPLLVDELEATDFATEFLLFFGMVLNPSKQQLQTGKTELTDGTLTAEYRIDSHSSANTNRRINTIIQRYEAIDSLEDVAFTVHYPAESVPTKTA